MIKAEAGFASQAEMNAAQVEEVFRVRYLEMVRLAGCWERTIRRTSPRRRSPG
jgi:hypothetical protein